MSEKISVSSRLFLTGKCVFTHLPEQTVISAAKLAEFAEKNFYFKRRRSALDKSGWFVSHW